jgi:hypothetical protein
VTEVTVVGSWRRSSFSGSEGNCVELRWRKSTRSGSEANCVELNQSLDAVRDSKNPAGPILRAADLQSFVLAAKAGQFDR